MQFIVSGERIATENFSIGKVYTVTFTNGNYFINSCVGIGPDFVMFQQESPKMLFCLDMESAETVSSIDESGGGAGTMNYNELDNKPSINGVILVGNKTAADLSILPVPIVGENDNNKILTASYSGGVGSYSWQPAPSSGTTDYTQLTNKPQINSVELNGNKSLADLGIASAEALAGKQDVISDLSTIRSGAAAGATAVQPATLAGYQTLIDSSHKLSSDLVDDDGHTNKFATAAQLTQIETNKTNILMVNGAVVGKNRATINSGTFTATSDTRYINIPCKGITGDITLSFGTLSTTHSGGGNMAIVLKDASNNTIVSTAINPANTLHIAVTANSEVRNINIYPAADWGSTTEGDTLTFSDFMVCMTTEYAADSNYTPYAPSNAELYAMIQALQS